MQVMLDNKVIPIVNENDTVSVSELMFTDNDELSGLIASMMDMEALIILSNIDGIFDGSPSNPESKVIRQIEKGQDISDFIQTTKSTFGRGGMSTKIAIAQKIADEGIDVFIANGKIDNILIRLLDKKDDVVCTRFVASTEEVSSVKKWIAHSEGFAKGEITASLDTATIGNVPVNMPETPARSGPNTPFRTGRGRALAPGAGVRYIGDFYANNQNTLKNPSQTLVDAALYYTKDNWKFQLNAKNLFDDQVALNNEGYWYWSQGRTVVLSAKYRW